MHPHLLWSPSHERHATTSIVYDIMTSSDSAKLSPVAQQSQQASTTSTCNGQQSQPIASSAMVVETLEVDDFGLPIKRYSGPTNESAPHENSASRNQQAPANSKDETSPDQPKPSPESELRETDTEHKTGSQPLPTADKVQGTVGEGDIAKDVSKRDSTVPDHHLRKHSREESITGELGISEFSHQHITKSKDGEDNDEGEWQEMPAYAPYDMYDDDDRLVAKEHHEEEDEKYGYAGLGGAGKGYTRLLLDDDAESATSMDENTQYLFKNAGGTSMMDEDDQQRDAVSQLQATKDLLTEGQRIAYVGLTRLELSSMVKDTEGVDTACRAKQKPKKEVQLAAEAMKMWAQKMMIRLYSHMDISPDEQVMIEQLSEHGVIPADLKRALMQNSRVQNPMREKEDADKHKEVTGMMSTHVDRKGDESPAEPPPAYGAQANQGENMPGLRTPNQLPATEDIDIDLRWTVLCDLFLVLIADSIYDARSRVLMERVGENLEIPRLDICRFEKRVTDALEMQQQAEKENWNEEEHMEKRRKMALKRRYVMMGLATVGGGLVIGLSAGLLAPMIGAGLAAGFTTIGVSGTGTFLASTASAAIITSSAAASGSYIGGKAANRRTGAVKTYEYRPLHNNKRVNLIVTVSGWMTGKVDDVRLPFSTIDPIMGDIYSILWEPEMLTSMGDTINILATEALTQGLQQVLGSTILMGLMAALQLPIVLTKLSYLIDNPWAVSLDRATAAGLILADSLVERNLGTRPVTLVGYSLGSRVIFSCLQELAKKGAYGLVQNVYMFGSPVVVKRDEYLKARTVVAGTFVNGFNRNDWILGYLFRLTNGGIRRVAGLASVDEVAGIENKDVTDYVVGHMDYRQAMPRLLREVCGWLVESDEFTEIEDPDPDKHKERQRELINEIEEARKELGKEEDGKKRSRFGIFGRTKKLEKAEWEVYQDSKGRSGIDVVDGDHTEPSGKTEDAEGNNYGVLFDVDAIRAELAKEAAREKREKETGMSTSNVKEMDEEAAVFQVKEIKSTLPPMKLDVSSWPSKPSTPAPETASRPSGSASFNPSPSCSHRPSVNDFSSREAKSTSNLPYRLSSFDSKRNTSPLPPAKSPAHLYGMETEGAGEDEGHISMTFDTSFRDPSPPPPAGAGNNGMGGVGFTKPTLTVTDTCSVWASENSRGSGYGIGHASGHAHDAGSSSAYRDMDDSFNADSTVEARPEVRSSKTAPTAMPAANPWLDDEFDDPDFGKETGVSMTFA